MGTKNSPGKYDCLGKAEPDEPFFVLLARDPDAPELVEQWADRRHDRILAGQRPQTDLAKVAEARSLAYAMRQWQESRDKDK